MIWIDGIRLTSAAELPPGAPDKMKEWVTDGTARSYRTGREAVAHAEGGTDYLGNLPDHTPAPGTWLRFHPTGLNIIGEDHAYLTAEVAGLAVGATRFISEAFVTDDLSPYPHLDALYHELHDGELARLRAHLGEEVTSLRRFGAESMFPRMGFDMAVIVHNLQNADSTGLDAGSYAGRPMQAAIRLAWAYTKDVAAKDPATRTEAESTLATAPVNEIIAFDKLDGFIAGLSSDGYLGDSLTAAPDPLMRVALQLLAYNVTDAMLERIHTDHIISGSEKTTLAAMPKQTIPDRKMLFRLWRNLHFAHTVEAAARDGVRYAGMGAEHVRYLVQEGKIPDGGHFYYILEKDLAELTRWTEAMLEP